MRGQGGICSVTFRGLKPEALIRLVGESGLSLVEWGGDIHVPPADVNQAEAVRAQTAAGGLGCVSYGSYFRCGDPADFEEVSRAAEMLGADIIRIWAGTKEPHECSDADLDALVATAQACADVAARRGQTVAFEYHHCTYCRSAEAVKRLLCRIDRPNVKTYWQPMYWESYESDAERIAANIRSIDLLRDDIVAVHVYQWQGHTRFPLADGEAEWDAYLTHLPPVPCYLEFVQDDREECFLRDAATLRSLLTKKST